MKTFKLKSLEVVQVVGTEIVHKPIPLIDGLIINREDDEDQWIIEAFTEQKHFSYFEDLQETNNNLITEVKITKKTNEPALFMTSIMGLHKIKSHISVLFKGIIINASKDKVEEELTSLTQDDLDGEALMNRFNKKIKHI